MKSSKLTAGTQPEAPETLYSEREAADRLGVSQVTLLRRRRAGLIGYYRIGTRVVYSETKHIQPFLQSCDRRPAGEGPQSGKAA